MVQDDGKVRLVLKDWPILGEVSKFGARMALAAKYQDKYMAAHEAMIGVSSKLTEPRIRELLAGAGIDMDRLNRDATTNAKAIDTILARNHDQAVAFGFKGTPSFIVGKFRVPGILTMAEFEMVIADARKAPSPRSRFEMVGTLRFAHPTIRGDFTCRANHQNLSSPFRKNIPLSFSRKSSA